MWGYSCTSSKQNWPPANSVSFQDFSSLQHIYNDPTHNLSLLMTQHLNFLIPFYYSLFHFLRIITVLSCVISIQSQIHCSLHLIWQASPFPLKEEIHFKESSSATLNYAYPSQHVVIICQPRPKIYSFLLSILPNRQTRFKLDSVILQITTSFFLKSLFYTNSLSFLNSCFYGTWSLGFGNTLVLRSFRNGCIRCIRWGFIDRLS